MPTSLPPLPPLSVFGVRGSITSHSFWQSADLDSAEYDGDSPLHSAVQKGHTDVVQLLLERGADTTIRDNSGKTALDLTARADIRSLLEGRAVATTFSSSLPGGHLLDRQRDCWKQERERALDMRYQAPPRNPLDQNLDADHLFYQQRTIIGRTTNMSPQQPPRKYL